MKNVLVLQITSITTKADQSLSPNLQCSKVSQPMVDLLDVVWALAGTKAYFYY